MRLSLTLSFNGAKYCGWQCQRNGRSVQETVCRALESVFNTKIAVSGCGRTDAGVHAENYVCHFDLPIEFDIEKLPKILNFHLPDDINAVSVKPERDDFHARYDAVGKEYVYKVFNSEVKSVFAAELCFKHYHPIDAEKLDGIAKGFVGSHDFTSFMTAGSKIKETVREVKYFNVERDGEYVYFTVCADGFLYNMVRIMVGTLLFTKDLDRARLSEIISAKSRKAAGVTVPPHGLYLNKVFY